MNGPPHRFHGVLSLTSQSGMTLRGQGEMIFEQARNLVRFSVSVEFSSHFKSSIEEMTRAACLTYVPWEDGISRDFTEGITTYAGLPVPFADCPIKFKSWLTKEIAEFEIQSVLGDTMTKFYQNPFHLFELHNLKIKMLGSGVALPSRGYSPPQALWTRIEYGKPLGPIWLVQGILPGKKEGKFDVAPSSLLVVRGESAEEIEEGVDDLTRLMTFATGQDISWDSHLQLDGLPLQKSYERKSRRIRLLSTEADFPVIHPFIFSEKGPQGLNKFIEKAGPEASKLGKERLSNLKYCMDILAASHQAKVMEVSALMALIALERVLDVLGVPENRYTSSERNELLKILEVGISDTQLSIELQERAMSMLSRFGQNSFASKIDHALRHWKLPKLEEYTVKDIVAVRGSLAHGANYPSSIPSDDKWKFLLEAWHLVDVIVLRILQYSGTYLDCRHRAEPRELEPL